MRFRSTPIKDLLVLEPTVYRDERGYFYESFSEHQFAEAGLDYKFVQDNQSESIRGTLRGLHYQTGSMAQAKLVRVISGEVLDVVVDLRPKSETYLQHFCIELSSDNKLQLLIPRGFAHGFLTLQDSSIFAYKCDNFYSRAHDAGVRFDDPALNIPWPTLDVPYRLSEKDLALPSVAAAGILK